MTAAGSLLARALSQYGASTSLSAAAAVAAASATSSKNNSAVWGSVSGFEPAAFAQWQGRRWATKKQGGSTKNKKDSQPKYLGAKMTGGQLAFPGQLLVKQRGTRFHPGHNVGQGVDFTLYSKTVGLVQFRHERVVLRGRADKAAKHRRFVDVLPLNDDWSPGYKAKVSAMVEARNAIRRDMLGYAAKYGKK